MFVHAHALRDAAAGLSCLLSTSLASGYVVAMDGKGRPLAWRGRTLATRISLLSGTTLYQRIGDAPWWAALLIAAAWAGREASLKARRALGARVSARSAAHTEPPRPRARRKHCLRA